jgi:hypothetical protein
MLVRFLSLGLLVLGVTGNVAHAQAAAESVLLNGHVGLAGGKVGTAMGNSLSRATSGIAGQIQNVPQTKVVVHRNPRTPTSSRSSRVSSTTATPTPVAPASGGSMITSIQGGHVSRSSTSSTPPQHN